MRGVLENTIENLINNFDRETLQEFFYLKAKDKWEEYTEPLPQYEDDFFVDIWRIGNLRLNDNSRVGVYTIATQKELTERSSKKKQFELGKKILKDHPDAGFFVFHDSEGNFRFSFIYSIYSGFKREFSHYKRHTYYVPVGKIYRTFKKALLEANFDTLENIVSAFSTQPLTKEFYTEIQNWYAWALKHAWFPGGKLEENLIRLITRLIFVWFLKERKLIPEEIFDPEFLKNVVNDFGKADYYYNVILQNLFFATLNRYPQDRRFAKKGTFLENRTEFGVKTLFRYQDKLLISETEFIKIFEEVPFINGGLFECLDNDSTYIDGFSREEKKRAKLPDFLFFSGEKEEDLSHFYGERKKTKVRGLINILKDYNFTADENSPIDVEVSLDPELLGHIFENLLACYNPETATTARKATGSYYTPKEIVDFMVEESLIECLKTKTGINEEKLRWLFSYEEIDSEKFEEKLNFSEEDKEKLINAIDSLKILDPAVGSGAFPMGVLHKLVHVLSKVDPKNKLWYELQYKKALYEVEKVLKIEDKAEREKLLKEINENFDESINYPDYARKLYLIENSIYGVDIQPIAIQICKLRFFLSLLIDQKIDPKKENYGIKPLPHLETKFVSANTLIGLEKPEINGLRQQNFIEVGKIAELKRELKELYKKHFRIKTRTEKKRLQDKAKVIRQKIKDLLIKNQWGEKEAEKIASFDIFDQTATADWFDPEWMLGVEDGFDIVIGNPPHGADLSDYLDKIIPYYSYYDSRKNSASFFMFLAHKLLKKDGVCAYIIPKSLSFVEGWRAPRDFIVNKNILLVTLDISKSFENVRLEQVVIIYKKAILSNNYRIKIGCGWDKSIKIIGDIEKKLVEQLDIIPCYLDNQKLRIFEKMQKDSIPLAHISRTFRGLPWQRKISIKGIPVLRGKNITRYGIKDSIDKIALSPKDKRNKKVLALKQKKIVSQRIVAHVMNPYDHIIVMATLDNEGLLTLDTCMNTILTDSAFTYEYILALLNSTLASWFYYWFVYNRAIRTMDFDEYYLGKLPVKKIPLKEQEFFVSLVNDILSIKSRDLDADTSSIEKEINKKIYEIYSLNEDEISLIENRK